MYKSLLLIVRKPAALFCALLVLGLAIYFVIDMSLIYGKLDFLSTDIGNSPASDFIVFYSSARYLCSGGELSALYDPSTLKAFQAALGAKQTGFHTFNYPPPYASLTAPLCVMPYATALIVWQWTTLAAFAYSLHRAGLTPFEILAVCAAPASNDNMAAGQNGFLTSALLIAGMISLARRPVTAGSLFGLLTMKPHLGLLVPFACLAERRWRTISAAVLVAATLVGASILITGIEAWSAYFQFLSWFEAVAQIQHGAPFLALATTPYMALQIADFEMPLELSIQIAITLCISGMVYIAYRRDGDPDLKLAFLLVGTSLATPYGFFYDLPFVAVAVVLVVRHGLRDGFLPFEGFCLLVAFVTPIIARPLNEAGFPIAPVAHLAVFIYIAVRLRRQTVVPVLAQSTGARKLPPPRPI
jgi:hypothetical protein